MTRVDKGGLPLDRVKEAGKNASETPLIGKSSKEDKEESSQLNSIELKSTQLESSAVNSTLQPVSTKLPTPQGFLKPEGKSTETEENNP